MSFICTMIYSLSLKLYLRDTQLGGIGYWVLGIGNLSNGINFVRLCIVKYKKADKISFCQYLISCTNAFSIETEAIGFKWILSQSDLNQRPLAELGVWGRPLEGVVEICSADSR